jgi:hypothetical protein
MPVYPQSIVETLRTKKEKQTKLKDTIKTSLPSIKADNKPQETKKSWTIKRIAKRIFVIGGIIALVIGLYFLIKRLKALVKQLKAQRPQPRQPQTQTPQTQETQAQRPQVTEPPARQTRRPRKKLCTCKCKCCKNCPECQKRKCSGVKRQYNTTPEERARRSARMKKLWQERREEMRQKIKDGTKKSKEFRCTCNCSCCLKCPICRKSKIEIKSPKITPEIKQDSPNLSFRKLTEGQDTSAMCVYPRNDAHPFLRIFIEGLFALSCAPNMKRATEVCHETS